MPFWARNDCEALVPLQYMRQHGSSLTLSWDEESGRWEVCRITGAPQHWAPREYGGGDLQGVGGGVEKHA